MYKFFLYLLILFPNCLAAQYIFNNLQTKDGLSAKQVNCIFKDQEGFVWIGTVNGLNRYDGSNIKVFNQAHNNLTGLKDENITAVDEFGAGKIFIGTQKELVIYDKQTGVVVPVPFINEANDTIQEMIVTKLMTTPKYLFIATVKGLFVYDKGFFFNSGSPASPNWKPLSDINLPFYKATSDNGSAFQIENYQSLYSSSAIRG